MAELDPAPSDALRSKHIGAAKLPPALPPRAIRKRNRAAVSSSNTPTGVCRMIEGGIGIVVPRNRQRAYMTEQSGVNVPGESAARPR